LLVDEDPEVLDLIARQVLEPLGYLVATADDAGAAIQQSLNYAPDLIIASLTLPGLSGKDLLVALRSQGMEVPMLVTAREGMEADAIQAFRLGARDYLVKPLREAEVVSAIDRAINEIREQSPAGEARPGAHDAVWHRQGRHLDDQPGCPFRQAHGRQPVRHRSRYGVGPSEGRQL
jgi:DNA-binding response OmpR family regulator